MTRSYFRKPLYYFMQCFFAWSRLVSARIGTATIMRVLPKNIRDFIAECDKRPRFPCQKAGLSSWGVTHAVPSLRCRVAGITEIHEF